MQMSIQRYETHEETGKDCQIKGKSKYLETDPTETEAHQLLDKWFKVNIIKKLNELKKMMHEQ